MGAPRALSCSRGSDAMPLYCRDGVLFSKALTTASESGPLNRVVGALTKVNHRPFSLPAAEPTAAHVVD
jgi:hypothetical protein